MVLSSCRNLPSTAMERSLNKILSGRYMIGHLKKAGLQHVKLHGQRHSFISILLSKGIPPFYVAEQVGDTLKTIVEHYAHFIRTACEKPCAPIPFRSLPRITGCLLLFFRWQLRHVRRTSFYPMGRL